MRAVRHPHLVLVIVLLSGVSLSACGGGDAGTDGDPREPSFSYSAELEAPTPREYDDSSDELPGPDDGLQRLELDSGAEVVIWIDPDDIRDVVVQHSDPDDPGAWTEPETILTAGDGCLTMGAETDGRIVAIGLGCYEDDAFIQQAPDQGAALVTTDLVDWDVKDDIVEFSSDPEIEDGVVTFENSVYEDSGYTWTESDGFDRYED